MYRMCAALLYTEEGQDWAPRCPPIAPGALSFYCNWADTAATAATGPSVRAPARLREPMRLVPCAGVGPCGTRGGLSPSVRPACQPQGGLNKCATGERARCAPIARAHCAHPLRASKACSWDTPASTVLAFAFGSGLHPGAVGVHKWAALGGGGRTMLLRTLAALVALAIGGIATSSGASAKGSGRSQGPALDANWVLLEARAVDLKKEKERFTVGASKGRFKSVLLVGVDRRIDIKSRHDCHGRRALYRCGAPRTRARTAFAPRSGSAMTAAWSRTLTYPTACISARRDRPRSSCGDCAPHPGCRTPARRRPAGSGSERARST